MSPKSPRRDPRPPLVSLAEHEAAKWNIGVIPCHNEEMNIGQLIVRVLDAYVPRRRDGR
jgi:hypothetical protein